MVYSSVSLSFFARISTARKETVMKPPPMNASTLIVSPVFTMPFVAALVVVVVVGSSTTALARFASFTSPVVSDGSAGSEGSVTEGAAVVSEDVVPDS